MAANPIISTHQAQDGSKRSLTRATRLALVQQVIICLASFIAVASASTLIAPAAIPAAVSTGVSSQYRSQNSVGDYTFGYNEDHPSGGSFRREAGNLAGKTGSYGLRDIDGRTRIVNYVADAAGFRASIQTNEPGVEPKDPAATLINKAVAVGKCLSSYIDHNLAHLTTRYNLLINHSTLTNHYYHHL